MLGKRPSKKAAEAARLAVQHAEDKSGDGARAQAIWTDLRFKMKTTCSNYKEVDNLILDCIIRARTELITREWRDPVVKRLEEMRARVSEFTVEEDGPMEICFCSVCGREILPGAYRKPQEGQIEAYLCAICAAA